MKLEQARRLVRVCDGVDAALVHERGCAWVEARLRPAVALVEEAGQAETAARGLNVLATMAELNEGYGESLRLLDRSLERWPQYVLSWFDRGWVEQSLGRLDAARKAYEQALSLDPEHERARAMLDALHDPPPQPATPLDDWRTRAADALARFDAAAALAEVGERTDSDARVWRACAHGARGDAAAALVEWEALAAAKGTVRLSPAAWYYLADDLFEEARFWAAVVAMAPRCERSVCATHPSLLASLQDSEDDVEAVNRRVLALMAQFHLALARADEKAMRTLADAHPAWDEAAAMAEEL